MRNGAVDYLAFVQRKIDELERELPGISRAAELAAEKIVEGGKLYVASDEEGFRNELLSRAGGLMGIHGLDLASPTSEGDVVLIGVLYQNPKNSRLLLQQHRDKHGPLVVAFASSESAIREDCDVLINNNLPAGAAPVIHYREERICPAGGVVNIATAWTFIAEYVAACLRLGKMPVCWRSACVPGGMKWNEKHMGRTFHEPEEFSTDEIPPGKLGKAYLSCLQDSLHGIETAETAQFQRAGHLASAAITSGNAVWCDCIGHHMPAQKGMPGDPGMIRMVFPERKETSGPFASGDVFFYNGYFLYPEQVLADIRSAGIPSVWILGGRERMPALKADSPGQREEIHIDAHWHYGDACVKVPGYDTRIIPPSGVIMTTTLWMLIAEIAGAMSL